MKPILYFFDHSHFLKYKIVQVKRPPYSLDLAPCHFFLFSKLIIYPKGTIEKLKMN